MSTALAIRDNAGAIEAREDKALAGLAPMTFEQIVQMGDALVRTGLLPEHIKTGGHAAAIILTGREMGMQPMRSIRSLQMVKGKVVESADSQLARFKSDGGHSVFRQLDEAGAVLFLKHPNGDEHEESFTVADAKAAGLLGKDMYGKFLKAMLRSRAITAGLKSIGWEGGVGNYDPSEALAFTAPNGSVAAESESTPAVEVVRDLAWALAFPFPFEVGKPTNGKPLAELGTKHLESIAKWIAKRQAEKADENWNADVLAAIRMVLNARALGDAKAPVAAAPVDTALAPGNVADALTKKEPGVAELAKSIERMIKHEKLTDTERAEFVAHAAAATSVADLKILIQEIEAVVESRLDDAP